MSRVLYHQKGDYFFQATFKLSTTNTIRIGGIDISKYDAIENLITLNGNRLYELSAHY